VPDMDDSLAV